MGNRLRSTLRDHWQALIVLAGVWVLLWGHLSPGTAIAGVIVALVVVAVFPAPRVRGGMTIRPIRLLVLVGHFVVELVTASFQVAWLAIRPAPQPRGGIVAVHMRPAPEVFFAMTSGLSTLVPGSLVVEADPTKAVIYQHVLDLHGSGGAEATRRRTLALEERVLRAFATAEDLAAAGLLAGRSRSAGLSGSQEGAP
ncbi:MAG: Na+/H+ antiporter subunit E [Cellulomonadaceae bacterium]|jgi:multicomponent Na+:H+ antiporter subunit E|nr:Na+/H+ antiporter subunit E [Cellulomonadaceae bacterium]